MTNTAMQEFIGATNMVENLQSAAPPGFKVDAIPVSRVPADQPEPDAILTAIMRAAEAPNFNVETMERLLAMHERMQDRQAKAAYNTALAVLQPLLPVITERGEIKDRNGNVQSRYAKWEDIIEEIRPLLSEHGFALSFRVGQNGDKIAVTGVLAHKDGHTEETTMLLPADTSGSKNAVQAVGSSTSYGKRYTAEALLNIISKGQDDDGRKAAAPQLITAEQKEQIIALMKETNADTAKFLEFMAVETLDELPFSKFNKAINLLNAKKKQAQK